MEQRQLVFDSIVDRKLIEKAERKQVLSGVRFIQKIVN